MMKTLLNKRSYKIKQSLESDCEATGDSAIRGHLYIVMMEKQIKVTQLTVSMELVLV